MSETTKLVSSAQEQRPDATSVRLAVPWFTVVSLAAVMAYADGFWIISLRGVVGSIERTQAPFMTWLRESTLALPLFVIAVLGALTLAVRRFGPVLRRPRTVLATALMVVAAGTLVGIAQIAASAVYDYQLQSKHLQMMEAMRSACLPGDCLARMEQATLDLHVRGGAYVSAILLVTNLVLVGWALAFRGGRLAVSTTRHQAARAPLPGPEQQGPDESALHLGTGVSSAPLPDRTPALAAATTADSAPRSRADDLRLLLAAGLFGSAAIHAAVVPEHLSEWSAAGVFFIVLTAAELAVGALLLARPQPTVLLAAAVASIAPLVVWLYSRTLGIPFGPEAGVPEQVGVADGAACVLEVGTLLLAVVLLRRSGWIRRPPASAHLRGLAVVAVIAVTSIGLAGSSLPWFNAFGSSVDQPATTSHHSR